MIDFAFSNHALEQMQVRGLTIDMVRAVIVNPDAIIEEGDNQRIYQSIVQKGNTNYLLRAFVNSDKDPNLVKTVYITSKINKYQ